MGEELTDAEALKKAGAIALSDDGVNVDNANLMRDVLIKARRLNIRERQDGDGKGTRAVATLNGTLATTRWIVAILEHHQNPDGSVTVPAALRPYLGGLEVLPVL